MATGVIQCGACGFTINVKAAKGDGHNVSLAITSECPNYQKIAKELTEVDAFKEIFNKLHTGKSTKSLPSIVLIPVARGFRAF